ncbi:MAG TPA: sulfite exporter TauE/SafE family protein [Longimicrobiales bacterium]|nr:sulfite exporter TauE/SafE family protein [Longimicrobiales bacterium]
MTIGVLLALALAGLAVGFLSGLVGIGGGVLIVPLLYFFYATPSWSGVAVPGHLEAVLAHATSLFVIVPTSALGTWTYHRAGAVAWRAALPIALFSVLAAVAGSLLAPRVPAPVLKLGFGILLVFSGARLLWPPRAGARPRRVRTSLWLGAVAGVAVGFMSALLGVGGGIVAIPILVYLVGLRLDRVAATSMAIIVFTALAGVVSYALSGAGTEGLPPGSVGYVHAAAGAPILVGSLLAVTLGARANLRLHDRHLRLLFGGLFLLLGLRLVLQNLGALAAM